MRKNVKQQLALRVLSTAALMAMVSSIATAAFADTYDLNTGSVTVETRDDGITNEPWHFRYVGTDAAMEMRETAEKLAALHA